MPGFEGFNAAVPGAGLLQPADHTKLAFDGRFWLQLNRYVRDVERLPDQADNVEPELTESTSKLKNAANSFGSPRHLRKLVTENPALLASASPPDSVYGGIVWLMQALGTSANKMVILVETLTAMAGKNGDEIKSGLNDVLAESSMFPAITFMNAFETLTLSLKKYSLKKFESEILAANGELAAPFKAAVSRLSTEQQAVGGLDFEVKSKEKEIGELGFFSSFTDKKEKLEKELNQLRQQLSDTRKKADELRALIAMIEPVRNTESWLAPGLENVSQFLETVGNVWTKLEADMTQLAKQATSTQLEDAEWFKSALGADEAKKQWRAISGACGAFTANALVDIVP